MKGRILRMGPILVTLLRPTEPAFRTEPCPDLDPDQRLDPTFWAERLEKLPTIPADTPVEIGNFTVRVGSLRWTYEYFSSYYRKTVRSECPWLYHEWEVRRTSNKPMMVDTEPDISLYLAIGTWARDEHVAEGCETWDPDPARKGEVGEGKRCRLVIHVRPEWGPRWMVISRQVSFFPTQFELIARVEVPPLPPR
jgi:hypothetical protein